MPVFLTAGYKKTEYICRCFDKVLIGRGFDSRRLQYEIILMKKCYIFLIYFFLSIGQLFSVNFNIRIYDHKDYTRIVFEGDKSFRYGMDNISKNSISLKIDNDIAVNKYKIDSGGSNLVDKIEYIPNKNKKLFRVSFKKGIKILKNFVLEKPYRVVFDVSLSEEQENSSENEKGKFIDDTVSSPESQDISKENITIDTICIDPGHGGSDFGAVGRGGVKEKDITLSIAKKLKNRVERKLGLRVIMTRSSDVAVALDSRVSKANNQKAQLFLSIHINSSFRRSARGPETYYVSLKATDQASYRLALKENGSINGSENIADNNDLKMILWNMAQTEYIKESSKLAEYIQNELNIVMNTVNRGVKQAPFRVLMRVSMPAVLVEVAFVSNKNEEMKLRNDTFIDSVADAIYNGVSKFVYYYNNRFK